LFEKPEIIETAFNKKFRTTLKPIVLM